MSPRRVAVTGLGVVSPVGNDVDTAWNNLIRGHSGLAEITKFDVARYEAKAAGEVRDFNPADWMDPKAVRRSESAMWFGVAAAKQALADSGFEITDANREDVGVVFGSFAAVLALYLVLAGDTEIVTGLSGKVEWPVLNRPGSAKAEGIWRGEKVTLIDIGTRKTRTSGFCDHSLRFKPNTDLAIACGIAHLLVARGWIDLFPSGSNTSGWSPWPAR